MTEEDLIERERQLMEARSPDEVEQVNRRWLGHLYRCQAHTATRVKNIERTCATKDDLGAAIDRLGAVIQAKHSAPKWSEDKAAWLMHYWLQILLTLYVLKTLGVELGGLLGLMGG